MRSDTRTRPVDPGIRPHVDPDRDPTRAMALDRLSHALAPRDTTPRPVAPWADPSPNTNPAPEAAAQPTLDPDPDGDRPDRVRPVAPDLTAWADPPWWRRVRWAPDKLAGVALIVLVVALGAFSVHRLLSTVPPGPAVPELPVVKPGETVPPDPASTSGQSVAPSGSGPTQQSADQAAGPDDESAAPDEVVVSVVGLVARSGLVTLEPGARVADALHAAGGVLDGGDRNGLNLARKLVDGEQILVGVAPGPDGPRGPQSNIVGPDGTTARGTAGTAGSAGSAGGSGTPAADDAPVNINTADAAGLESLPGVGPVTASSILAWREANGSFTHVDQLAQVDGIGPATLERLRPLVTV